MTSTNQAMDRKPRVYPTLVIDGLYPEFWRIPRRSVCIVLPELLMPCASLTATIVIVMPPLRFGRGADGRSAGYPVRKHVERRCLDRCLAPPSALSWWFDRSLYLLGCTRVVFSDPPCELVAAAWLVLMWLLHATVSFVRMYARRPPPPCLCPRRALEPATASAPKQGPGRLCCFGRAVPRLCSNYTHRVVNTCRVQALASSLFPEMTIAPSSQ